MGPDSVWVSDHGRMTCKDHAEPWCDHRQAFLNDRRDRTWFWGRMHEGFDSGDLKVYRMRIPLVPTEGIVPEVTLQPLPGGVDAGLKVLVMNKTKDIGATTFIGMLAPDVDSIKSVRELLVDWLRDQEEQASGTLVFCPTPFHQSREAKMFESNTRALGGPAVFRYNARVLLDGGCEKCMEIAESVGVSIDEVADAAPKGGSGLVGVEKKAFDGTTSSGMMSARSRHGLGKSFDLDLGIETSKMAKAFKSLRDSLAAATDEAREEMEKLKTVKAVSSRPAPPKPRLTVYEDETDDLPF